MAHALLVGDPLELGLKLLGLDADEPEGQDLARIVPELIKTVAHVAFEVDDVVEAIAGHKVIVEPNSPSRGVLVAMIEVNGAPVELLSIDRTICDPELR